MYTTTSSCSGRFDEHASLEAAIYHDINVITGLSVGEREMVVDAKNGDEVL